MRSVRLPLRATVSAMHSSRHVDGQCVLIGLALVNGAIQRGGFELLHPID